MVPLRDRVEAKTGETIGRGHVLALLYLLIASNIVSRYGARVYDEAVGIVTARSIRE